MFKQIMAALKYLHRREIVHGDMKPENILYENRPTWLTFFWPTLAMQKGFTPIITRVGTQIHLVPKVWDGTQRGFGLDI